MIFFIVFGYQFFMSIVLTIIVPASIIAHMSTWPSSDTVLISKLVIFFIFFGYQFFMSIVLTFIVPENIIAPISTWPSSDTVLISKLFSLAINFHLHFSMDGQCNWKYLKKTHKKTHTLWELPFKYQLCVYKVTVFCHHCTHRHHGTWIC